MDDQDQAAAFDVATWDARLVVEALGAALGTTGEDTSRRGNAITMLRIVGPRARSCEHLAGPTTVYLHSATGVHMCSACASSPLMLETIEAHSPAICDSCGDKYEALRECQFNVTNIVVTAYVCNRCRRGERAAVWPSWLENMPDAAPPPDP